MRSSMIPTSSHHADQRPVASRLVEQRQTDAKEIKRNGYIHSRNTSTTAIARTTGFISVLLLIIIALILLRTLDIPIGDILAIPWITEFFGTIKETLVLVFADLKTIVLFFFKS